ncbi:hypothetical protein Poli38472_011773 [Pythium oligandrum]|uniref:Amino acid permease/ SLC12A domain-containing protein n=1 Tax=Pythium oligandrum TaxID=41045 RepID=A0A8K1FCC8_PYTOL|nr:hypothetical protein Poli38472_011773 [Pythium oligandrum]|eukprot:TMW58185.1 hypothetical protein Poli38472_011773 [Pythium oligandrum]
MPRTPADVPLRPLARIGDKAGSDRSIPSAVVPLSKKKSYEITLLASGVLDVVKRLKYKPGKWDIWMLGITIVIGGQYFSWNVGLAAGLYSCLICYILIASAYVTLCCCASGITGALPFAGGAYGLARGTLGFLPAFLIGCCEALEYIVCFMQVLPLGCWFFVGVEALNLASDQVEQPKRMVPFGQMMCVLTLVVSGIFVFFVTVSLPPGINVLPTELVPFNNGFEPLFNMSQTNATILSLPATYATAFGFIWCYGKLIAAMATSQLLPVFLARTSKSGTPYMAIAVGSTLSYIICLIVYFVPTVSKCLFNICITAAFMSYTGQCVGYIALKKNYRNIKSSHFHSPFGIGGALYSMVIWILYIISIIGFQGNGGQEIMVCSIVVILLTVYYFAWARKRQTFSPQENKIMLVAHVMKFNVRRSMSSGTNLRKSIASTKTRSTAFSTRQC